MDYGWSKSCDTIYRFEHSYYCYSFSSIEKPHLDNGGKIIMPPSALDQLNFLRVEFPCMFSVENPTSGRVSHCGVLEFTAEDACVIMPEWMINNMKLDEGDVIILRNTVLEMGTYMKLQPHTESFFKLSNPKALLKTQLRNFNCLTAGDTIMVTHHEKRFCMDIIETKPSNAINVIEADCELDFAYALDEKQPDQATKRPKKDQEDVGIKQELNFVPFVGVARRLDGKPLPARVREDYSRVSATAATSSRRHAWKLVFGSDLTRRIVTDSTKVSKQANKEESLKSEGLKFQAFTGKKHTLMG